MILWAVAGLLIAFGAFYFALRQAHRRLPPIALPGGEAMPTTALQRLARRSLVAVVVPTLAAAVIVASRGLVSWTDDAVRLSATGLLLAALGVFVYYQSRLAAWTARDDGTLDERDRAILASAPAGQAPAILVTLAAWTIGLSETYWEAQSVPMSALYLIFWSVLLVSVIALLAGVVIGYRRL